MLTAGQHADGQAFELERRRGDRGALTGRVGAHTEDVAPLGLGDNGGVDLGVVGGRDDIPGTLEVAVTKLSKSNVIPCHGLDRRGGGAGNDVHVGSVGDQQR